MKKWKYHIQEIKYRSLYLIISYSLLLIISFENKETVLRGFFNPFFWISLKNNLFDPLMRWMSGRTACFAHSNSVLGLQRPFLSNHGYPKGTASLVLEENETPVTIQDPLSAYTLMFTHVTEAFFAIIKVSLFIAIIFIIPYFLYSLFAYLKVSLYKNEYLKTKNALNFFIFFYYPFSLLFIYFYLGIYPFVFNYFIRFADFGYKHALHTPQTCGASTHLQTPLWGHNPEGASRILEFKPKIDEFINFTITSTTFFIIIIIFFYLTIYFTHNTKTQHGHTHQRQNYEKPTGLNPLRGLAKREAPQVLRRSLVYFFFLLISAFITPPDLFSLIFSVLPFILIYEYYIWKKIRNTLCTFS